MDRVAPSMGRKGLAAAVPDPLSAGIFFQAATLTKYVTAHAAFTPRAEGSSALIVSYVDAPNLVALAVTSLGKTS